MTKKEVEQYHNLNAKVEKQKEREEYERLKAKFENKD